MAQARYVCVNGAYVAQDDACISTQDRGFRFGDGVFETIAVVGAIPYLWELHEARLTRGLDDIGMQADINNVLEQLLVLIKKNQLHDGVARVLVTRGCGSQGYLPLSTEATIVLEAEPCPLALSDDKPMQPIALWESQWRRIPPQCLPSHAKLMQGMNATLARMEAQEHDAQEALQLSIDGDVCEASSGNLFWLHDDVLCTPPLSSGALAGTMRERLMVLWEGGVHESTITVQQLCDMQAVMMTNALRGAVPISGIMNRNCHFYDSVALVKHCNALIFSDIVSYRERFAENIQPSCQNSASDHVS